MSITQEQINDLYDAEVVTQDDDNLGGVGEVYLDDQTGEPSWISVKTGWFGARQSLVPLQDADLSGGRIRVPHTKDTIKNAPNVDADQHLSEEEQDELFRYYSGAGVDTSRYGADGLDDRRDVTEADPAVAGGFSAGGADSDLDRDRGTLADTDRDSDVDRDRGAGLGGDRDLDVDRDRGAELGGGVGREREGSMTLHEEQVDVGTERVETGRVRLRKHVVTDQETVTVPVQREEFEVVREPVAGEDARDGARLGEDEAEVTLHEERPVVDKDVVATERVGLEKQTVTDEQQVVTDVSHEEVDVDRDTTGDAGIADGGPRQGDWDGDGVRGEGLDLDGDNRRG
ncbi:DUF2382 domain-containing protein [Ornithinimicrobium flavum]|uniref:DUF2382 domain-containing protein n=1 Tax=Ornithinimicrobium flavum TaxID=1288636 RepID=UPI001EE98BE9|nr:PRC and DUF2382 domain-containing protein [Ornithinimicrobium flavum]